ncbi:MAG: cyanophycin synthetase, partial [Patescibacteria group bacterium]
AGATGTKFKVEGQEIDLALLGEFNAFNALAAVATGIGRQLSISEIKRGLEKVKTLAGKLELVRAGQNFTAIVDYSFEPKALEGLYKTVKLIPYNKIIHLLGSAGGGRDKSRRPILGRIAAENADYIVITNEDPYDEDPAAIINQVASGAEMAGKELNKNLFKILDRREAIKKALELAKEGDLVLFTGKGAEQAICVAEEKKIPWDEREEVRAAIVDKMCIDKK